MGDHPNRIRAAFVTGPGRAIGRSAVVIVSVLASHPPLGAGPVIGLLAYAPLFAVLRRASWGQAAWVGVSLGLATAALGAWAAVGSSTPGSALAGLASLGIAYGVASTVAIRALLAR